MDIKELKKKADVVSIIGSRIELKSQGSHYVACCPFHGEKTPSFKLDDRQGEWLWKCFGCSAGGDVITFLEKFDRLDNKAAIERLAELAGSNAQFHAQAKKVTETFKPLTNDKKILTVPLEKWLPKEADLMASKAAVQWLTEVRGLTLDTIKQMHLGYIETMHGFGGGWVSFPRIKDEKVRAIKYRSILEKRFTQKEEMDSTALFNIESISPFDPVFVTEGELDACVFETCGYTSVVSLPSASTLPDADGKKSLMIAERVYLAGDNDPKGLECMQKLMRELASMKTKNVHLLLWPEGYKDASDFFRDYCKRDTKVFYTEVQRLMAEARNRAPENVEVLLTLMRTSQTNDQEKDPDRLHFPTELATVDRMTYTPKGGVVVLYSTYSGTGKSMLKTQILLHEATRGETVVDLSPEIRGPEYVSLVTSQTLGRMKGESVRRTERVSEEKIHEAADLLDVKTGKGGEFRYYVGFNIPGQNEEEVLEFIRSTVALLSATRFSIDTFHRLIHSTGKSNQAEAEGRMVKKLEEIGLELGCIFILICQSNAEAEGIENIKKNVHGVLRGSREIRDVPASIYLLHRNQVKQDKNGDGVDGKVPEDVLELAADIICKKSRFTGPGSPIAKFTLKKEWSLFLPQTDGRVSGDPGPQSAPPPQKQGEDQYFEQSPNEVY